MSTKKTFKNPILPNRHPDPWVIFKDGFYYYCGSGENNSIYVIRSKKLTKISLEEKVTVWRAPANGDHSKSIWAPELHWINHRWYIFYAADNGENPNHRMFVLESRGSDAQGEYLDLGKITDKSDKWAIDGTILQTEDETLFFVWSGWEGDVNEAQHLYIAPISKNAPWKITGDRVKLSSPTFEWERIGYPYVNEGPQIIKRNKRIYLIYSASGSWSPDYCLGMLYIEEGKDVLNPSNWVKVEKPVFTRDDEEHVYGVGHASFTTSPDGKEDWIVYHGMDNPDAGWEGRSARAQPFTWNADGTPNFGKPLGINRSIPSPSGE